MSERENIKYEEMNPSELKAEFLQIISMLPSSQPDANLSKREHSEVREILHARLGHLLVRTAFTASAREYFRDRRFRDFWVGGFDPNLASMRGFADVLNIVQADNFDICDPGDTQIVEKAAYSDMIAQLDALRNYKPRTNVEEMEMNSEIGSLRKFMQKWFQEISQNSQKNKF